VIRRDERNAGPPRGDQRAPGRRAASGVDEVHASVPDQSRKPPCIAPDRQRVLAGDLHLDDLTTPLRDRPRHAAAFADNQRLRSGPRQRLGDFECCQFAAAGIETRHDLQYCYRRHGRMFRAIP